MKAHISPAILAQDEVRFYCVFCTTLQNFESEAILNKHIVDAHFYAKFEKGLKKKPPFNCPFSFCRFNGRNAQVIGRLTFSCTKIMTQHDLQQISISDTQ